MRLNIPKTLTELGMQKGAHTDLIQRALSDPSCNGNPIQLNSHNLKLILDKALGN